MMFWNNLQDEKGQSEFREIICFKHKQVGLFVDWYGQEGG